MKKKLYFIISSIIQIVAFVYAIASADKIMNNLIKMIDVYPDSMKDRITDLYTNSGNTFVIILSSIGIILNLIIIGLACKNNLIRKKGLVITLLIFTFILAEYEIIQLLAIISIIVLLCSKEKVEKKEKEKIPTLKKEEVTKNKLINSIILLVIYFSQFIWGDYVPNNTSIKILISILFYVGIIAYSIYTFKDLYVDNFKEFKNHFSAYIHFLLTKIGIFYIIYIMVAMITVFISGDSVSANQSSIEKLPIFLSLPLAVIYAPIVEEAIFRGSLRRFIKNDKIFIVLSGLSFGLLHTVMSEATIVSALVMSLPYVTMGLFLAYLYVKSNNIFCNMTYHMLQNSLAMIMVILLKG